MAQHLGGALPIEPLFHGLLAAHATGIWAGWLTRDSRTEAFADIGQPSPAQRNWYADALQSFVAKQAINAADMDEILKAIPALDADGTERLRQEAYGAAFTMVREANQTLLDAVNLRMQKLIQDQATVGDVLHDLDDIYAAAGLRAQDDWYVRLVAANNMNRAFNEGVALEAQRMAEDGILWGHEWVHSGKEHFRPAHKALDGFAAPAGDPRWGQIGNPPIGHGCGCRRRPVTHFEAKRRGLPDSPPTPKIPAEDMAKLPPAMKKGLASGELNGSLDAITGLDRLPGQRFGKSEFQIPNRPLLNPSWGSGAIQAPGQAATAGNILRDILPKPKPQAIAQIPAGMEGAEIFGARLAITGDKVGGSTGARVYRDDEGARWIVKDYGGNETQVRNEYVANRLYQLNKVPVAEGRIARVDGRLNFASRMIDAPGLTPMGEAHVDWCAGTAAVQKGFVADAWLSNWDVAGTGWDNILCVPGKKAAVYRVDHGGALLYRAQGTPKGAAFGTDVTELASLRDPAKNAYAARLFAKVTDKDVAAQITTLRSRVTAAKIDAILADAGLTGPDAAHLAATLKARFAYLGKWQKEYRAAAKRITAAAPAKVLLHETISSMEAAFAKGWDTCTAEEKTALKRYTAHHYKRINKSLSDGKMEPEVVPLDRALTKLPRFKGMVGRGHCPINGLPGGWESIENWASGKWAYWDNKGYSSASPAVQKAWTKEFKVFIRLNGTHPGGWVDPQSSNKGELEYIVGRGFRGRVVGVGWNKSKTRAFLVVDESDDFAKIPGSQEPPPVLDYDVFIAKWQAEGKGKK